MTDDIRDRAREALTKTVLPIADSFAKDPDAVATRWADELLAALAVAGIALVDAVELDQLREELAQVDSDAQTDH